MAVQTLNRQWSSDWSIHAATVRELAARLAHPHHPLIGTSDLDSESSPYLAALGFGMRVTGLDVFAVLSIAAMINLLAFLVALPLFVRCFSTRGTAATWALVFILVLWGIEPWRWSGYLNLNSIGFGLPYPSMAAFALTLFTLALLHAWCVRPRLVAALGTGALGALVALVHPPTAVGAAIVAVAMLVWKWGALTARAWSHLTVAALLGLAILAAWPLYQFFSLFGHTAGFNAGNHGIYRAVVPRVLLLLLTLPALWLRWRRDRRDALVLLSIGAGSVFIVAGVVGDYTLGRTLPIAALGGQVALAIEVSRRIGEGDRRVAIAATSVAIVGIGFCAPALSRFIPRPILPSSLAGREELAPVTRGYSFLGVIPATTSSPSKQVETRGGPSPGVGRTVSPGGPAPFVQDAGRRTRDERARSFKTHDDAKRSSIIRRYGVRWLLLTPIYADDPSHAPLLALGRIVHRGRFVLVRLTQR